MRRITGRVTGFSLSLSLRVPVRQVLCCVQPGELFSLLTGIAVVASLPRLPVGTYYVDQSSLCS